MRFSTGQDRGVQVCMDLRGAELIAALSQHDFNSGVFQIDESLKRRVERQIGETLR
jgi:hypothetical protein